MRQIWKMDGKVDIGHGHKLAYTIEEAANLLSLSRAHLYRLIDLCEIGSITIGRSRRITRGQLEAFVSQLEERSRQPLRLSRNSCEDLAGLADLSHGHKSR